VAYSTVFVLQLGFLGRQEGFSARRALSPAALVDDVTSIAGRARGRVASRPPRRRAGAGRPAVDPAGVEAVPVPAEE
jgi:hypothetical protein